MVSANSAALRWSLNKLSTLQDEVREDVETKPRLLIVDDIADNRAILRRRFERKGFDILEADGGKAALEMIEAQDFDTVLLDFMMPDMDGVEVLREIRKHRPSAVLPVIMVTTRTQPADLVQALGEGADDYLTKPVDFDIALARVKTQLARRKAELRVLEAAQEIQKSNEVLENRVQQRTAKLEQINERLKQEIIQREKSEAESKYLAHHDALTGLANRVLFREVLEQHIRTLPEDQSELAILYLDLDGFKGVNDTLGHSVGDALLKVIASRLRNLLPDRDCIARLGGDEFAILHIGSEQTSRASVLAAEIIQTIGKICGVDGHEVTVGASLGITFCTSREDDPGDLLRNADLAMYRAKSDGRGVELH